MCDYGNSIDYDDCRNGNDNDNCRNGIYVCYNNDNYRNGNNNDNHRNSDNNDSDDINSNDNDINSNDKDSDDNNKVDSHRNDNSAFNHHLLNSVITILEYKTTPPTAILRRYPHMASMESQDQANARILQGACNKDLRPLHVQAD